MEEAIVGVGGRGVSFYSASIVEAVVGFAFSCAMCIGCRMLSSLCPLVSKESRFREFVDEGFFFVCENAGVVSFVPSHTTVCFRFVGKRSVSCHYQRVVFGVFAYADGGFCRLSHGRNVGDEKNTVFFFAEKRGAREIESIAFA